MCVRACVRVCVCVCVCVVCERTQPERLSAVWVCVSSDWSQRFRTRGCDIDGETRGVLKHSRQHLYVCHTVQIDGRMCVSPAAANQSDVGVQRNTVQSVMPLAMPST